MRLYDTKQRDYLDFQPEMLVKIYVCGIPPYDSAHLGHVFTFMTYDILQRRLEDMGHNVQLVRNITDVDEPIYARAKEMGMVYTDLAKQEIAAFQGVMHKLNFRPAYAEPLASDYVDQMAKAVKTLLDSGFGYYLDKDIYFDTAKYKQLDDFSGFSDRLLAGLFNMRGGDTELSGKRNPLDFLLWKDISDLSDPAQWETILGSGRPGWHIECSVMSQTILGTPFDIHGGGADLIFPHHTAEVAQGYGLGQPEVAKLWIHVAPLFSDGEKMSKSLGNLVFVDDLLKDHDPSVIRLALMNYHHRIGGEWQPELLKSSSQLLDRLHNAVAKADPEAAKRMLDEIRLAIDDDINTLEVLDALMRFVCSEQTSSDVISAQAYIKQAFDLIGIV